MGGGVLPGIGGRRVGRRPTFLAVVLVVVQDETAAALALVAAEGVEALVLAAPVVLGTLVFVCRESRGSTAERDGKARRPASRYGIPARHSPARCVPVPSPKPLPSGERPAKQAPTASSKQIRRPLPEPGQPPRVDGMGPPLPGFTHGHNHYLLTVRTGKAEKHTVTTKDAQERPGRGSPSLLIDREMSQTR